MAVKTSEIGNAAGQVAVELAKQATAPTAVPDKIQIYGKDVGGITEFFALDQNGQEVQVTSDGTLAASPSVLTSPYSSFTMSLGGPTLELTSGGVLYAPQQKWMRHNSFASPFSGFHQMFTLEKSNRAINTVEVLLVAGTDQNTLFFTHKHTALHVCDLDSNFVSGLNGTGLLSSSTPGSPFTVTTELVGQDVYLRVVNGGSGNKEWWAVATLSVSNFAFAPTEPS